MGFFGNIGAEVPEVRKFKKGKYYRIPRDTTFKIKFPLEDYFRVFRKIDDGRGNCKNCSFNETPMCSHMECSDLDCVFIEIK